jgi:hypothetical protein
MHIIIAVITALAGLIWALFRLQNSGVDLNSFNPFYWLRRKKWEKQLGTKAIHRLENPMEAAALLVVAVATYETGVTRELRNEVTTLLETEFQIANAQAVELFSASLHLIRDAGSLEAEVRNILGPSKAKLNKQQIDSLLGMLNKAASFEAHATAAKERIIKSVEKELAPR